MKDTIFIAFLALLLTNYAYAQNNTERLIIMGY